MKTIAQILLITITCISFCFGQKKGSNKFLLNGKIKTEYSGYLYFYYENKIDSCLVSNQQFTFLGEIKKNECVGSFANGKMSSMLNNFYLEKGNIQIELDYKVKNVKGNNLTFFEIVKVEGSTTAKIQKDYENFTAKYNSNKNWKTLLFKKVNELVNKYPSNSYIGDLIADLVLEQSLPKDKIRAIYSKLHKENQDTETILTIEKVIFDKKSIHVNDSVSYFTLPDHNKVLFHSNVLKGKYYLIDFWASWCKPCRESFPHLKSIYNSYKDSNFEILAVSIDKDFDNWKQALKNDDLNWINVLENKGFDGDLVRLYDIQAIPCNFLINPDGVVIAKNIDFENLKKFLQENLK